jgi:hypothetical protein
MADQDTPGKRGCEEIYYTKETIVKIACLLIQASHLKGKDEYEQI